MDQNVKNLWNIHTLSIIKFLNIVLISLESGVNSSSINVSRGQDKGSVGINTTATIFKIKPPYWITNILYTGRFLDALASLDFKLPLKLFYMFFSSDFHIMNDNEWQSIIINDNQW